MKCIYKIRNKNNNKFYLGSSKNFSHRKCEHKRDLSLNKHHSPRLQHAWNKYGPESFVFEIVEEFSKDYSDKLLLEREQYWIDNLKPCDDSIGYNISPNAHGGWRGQLPKHSKKVKQFTLDGQFVKLWSHAGQIQKELGLRVYAALRPAPCMKNNLRSIGGYVWCYEDQEPTIYNSYGDAMKHKPVLQYTKKGVLLKQWGSVTEAMKVLNIWGIEAAANGYRGRKSAHGFIWIFEGEEHRLEQCMAKRCSLLKLNINKDVVAV
jgi:predicted GIY-YIG superfamily endonuclease